MEYYWTRSTDRNSFESIGVPYDEGDANPTGAAIVGERLRRVQVTTPERPVPLYTLRSNQDREWSAFTDELTTSDTTGFTSSSRQQSGLAVHHRGDNSLGFTFSGRPADVVCFRSCIAYHLHKSSRKLVAPEQTGPFDADVLCIILLYIAVDMREILQVSHTCRYWRFHANYAPHWTYYRRLDWGKRIKDLPSYIQKVVVKPKIVTQEEYFRERRKVQAAQRRDEVMSTARHIRWCVAISVLSAAACAANFVVAYFLGFLSTVLRNDESLGSVTFLLIVVMVLLEVTVVIVPLGGAASPSEKQNMMRLLAWGLFLLLTGCIFGTMSAIAMARVQSNNHVLDGTVLDHTMNAECSVIKSRNKPSFALLPAQLTDIRWRPITMDNDEKKFIPYCISRSNETMCYVFLYFDEFYKSDVFNNSTAVVTKDIGTRTALGFDPIGNDTELWCGTSGRPQLVALSETVYDRVKERRNLLFPDEIYTDVKHRPYYTTLRSYLCSMDHARAKTENPSGSTRMWYEYGLPWRRHYIALLTDLVDSRENYQSKHDHYVNYAAFCYIATSVIWFVMLVMQCLTREQGLLLLGVTTTITIILINPIVLVISGALCVELPDYYFMCSESSGGAMIGGGIFITAFLVAVYVCFS